MSVTSERGELQGQRALVTGAPSGIGRAIAAQLGRMGSPDAPTDAKRTRFRAFQ
jgi:NAD(P)-dependent dehydrogenase (short-subunit alcohol dehydrogenase family)